LYQTDIWKAEKGGGMSTNIKTVCPEGIKPNYTLEFIDGKVYEWQKGKKVLTDKKVPEPPIKNKKTAEEKANH
jgi:hypothetical protein